jgi:hypothetical protein
VVTPAGLTAHEKQNYDNQKNKAHRSVLWVRLYADLERFTV